MPFLLFLLLVGLPILEIALLIKLGGWIGFWPTLGLIIFTAFLGTVLLRQQGLSVLARAQSSLEKGGIPVEAVYDGIALLVAGALLLTPGIVTDSFGFLLLVPGFRKWLAKALLQYIKKSGKFSYSSTHFGSDGTTEGYYYESRSSGSGTASTHHQKTGEDKHRDIQDLEIVDEVSPDDIKADPNPDSPWIKGKK